MTYSFGNGGNIQMCDVGGVMQLVETTPSGTKLFYGPGKEYRREIPPHIAVRSRYDWLLGATLKTT